MPLTARRSGQLFRVVSIAAILALIFTSCAADQGADSPGSDSSGSDSAAVLGAAAAPAGKYVSPSGDNNNPGTSPDRPFKTVAYAVKQLNPGDTLYVMEGEFFENERVDSAVVVDRSGTSDAWITITAQPGATPVLRSNQSNGIKVEGASYVEISNLELIGNPNGGSSSYSGAGINVDAIYGPAKNHHVRVLNNRISGFGAGGIPVTGSSHVEIRDNVVHNVAEVEWTQHSGISILESFNMGHGNDSEGYSNYVTGNVVYQVENKVRDRNGRFTDGNCIIMDRTNINNYSGRTLIANNLCVDNGGRGIQIFESKHVDVVNNTVYHNLKTPEIAGSGGELGAFYSSDVEFANNLVFARAGLKPARSFDSSDIRFVKNLYVADTSPEYNGASNDDRRIDPGTPVVDSPSTNPNPSNFKLKTGSPAVNAGTNKFNAAMAKDLVGAARVAGGNVDQGALESSSSAPAPTTTATPTTATPTTATPTTATPTTAPPSTTQTTWTPTAQSPSTATNRIPSTVPSGPGDTTATTSGAAIADDSSNTSSTAVSRPPTTENTATFDASPRAGESSLADSDPSGDPPSADGPEDLVMAPPPARATAAPTSPVDDGGDPGTASGAPDALAFDGGPAPQAPIPLEIPLAALGALALLASYYRPSKAEQQLG